MGNIIVVIVLVVIAALALRSAIKHFRGQGGCCGGCCDLKTEKKKLSGPKTGEKRITIEGMHCEHCKNTVEKELNRIDGAAARVDLKTNSAKVELSREISDEELSSAVERVGFRAVRIERVGA